MIAKFRIGDSHCYVKPGDHVWTDYKEVTTCHPGCPPVVIDKVMHGRVRFDGTVLLDDGKIVELRICRITEKVIKI